KSLLLLCDMDAKDRALRWRFNGPTDYCISPPLRPWPARRCLRYSAGMSANPSVRRPWWRRTLRFLFIAALLWIAATASIVLLLRFIPPPTSAFMLERRVAAWRAGERNFALKYHWVAREQVSAELPIALVASEDQKFPTHHGFDVQAIQDAMDEAEE